MDSKTRRIEIAVGLFVLVSLTVAVAGFFVLLREEHVFERRISVSAVFENARGLRAGAPVWLSGIGIGSVQKVMFEADNRAHVLMSIRRSAQPRIHRDAVARIVPISLVGSDTMVLLTSGSPSEPSISDGHTVGTEETPDWNDFVTMIAPGLEHLDTVLANIKDLTDYAAQPDGTFQTALKDVAAIVGAIERGEGTLGALVNDRQMYNEAVKLVETSAQAATEMRAAAVQLRVSSEHWPETVAKADAAAENARIAAEKLVALIDDAQTVTTDARTLAANLREASEDVPAITRSSKQIAANIESITENLRVASDSVPALVESSREGIEEATGVVKAAKRTWLLRRYFFPSKKPDTSVTVDRREGLAPSQ